MNCIQNAVLLTGLSLVLSMGLSKRQSFTLLALFKGARAHTSKHRIFFELVDGPAGPPPIHGLVGVGSSSPALDAVWLPPKLCASSEVITNVK
uniref:Secreted protein n=1 Tax=Physcomitrium patens TaxID=3218 RepID=A0A2K1IMY7_PHYPA|nr:hypothetical protein PHYPA_026944 [Physcomitrium patens]